MVEQRNAAAAETKSNSSRKKQPDRYKLVRQLGEGSQAKCFEVVSKVTGIHWAIKRVNLYNIDRDQRRIALQESRILECLDHPNVIQFKDVYKDK